MKIEDLELTIRSSNALKNAGITTVEQLVALDWKELSAIKNAGEKSLTEICWQCIRLLNGRLLESRLNFERRNWPGRIDTDEAIAMLDTLISHTKNIRKTLIEHRMITPNPDKDAA